MGNVEAMGKEHLRGCIARGTAPIKQFIVPTEPRAALQIVTRGFMPEQRAYIIFSVGENWFHRRERDRLRGQGRGPEIFPRGSHCIFPGPHSSFVFTLVPAGHPCEKTLRSHENLYFTKRPRLFSFRAPFGLAQPAPLARNLAAGRETVMTGCQRGLDDNLMLPLNDCDCVVAF